MAAVNLPAGSLLLTGEDLALVGYAVTVAQRWRQRNGQPPVAGLARLADTLAAPGQSDTPEEHPREPEFMNTTATAAALGISERTARRLAPRLGGRLEGGRWLFDRLAVAEHAAGGTRP